MKMKRKWAPVHFGRLVKILALFAVCISPSTAWSEWENVGSDARLALYMPQARADNTYAMLIINYQKGFLIGCRPEIATVLMTGRKLGSFVKQASAKKHPLVISVDGRRFTGKTTINFYKNGIEKAMSAPNGLISAMSETPNSVVALIERGHAVDFSGQPGFDEANRSALANCKQ